MNDVTVKLLRVLPREVVPCTYCKVPVRKRGILVRELDDRGALQELLFFCSHGCGIAYAHDREPDDETDEVCCEM